MDLVHSVRAYSGENFIGAEVVAGVNRHRSPSTVCAQYNAGYSRNAIFTDTALLRQLAERAAIVAVLVSGLFYFQKMEATIADVV